jgi:enoyl reductase-like protein
MAEAIHVWHQLQAVRWLLLLGGFGGHWKLPCSSSFVSPLVSASLTYPASPADGISFGVAARVRLESVAPVTVAAVAILAGTASGLLWLLLKFCYS